jgi:hypothetical protein
MTWYSVQSIKRENLTASEKHWDAVSRQAVGERSFICKGGAQRLVLSLSPCLVFVFWSLIVCGPSTSLRSAVQMASTSQLFRSRKGNRENGIGGHLRDRQLVPCAFSTVAIPLPNLTHTPMFLSLIVSPSEIIRIICGVDVVRSYVSAAPCAKLDGYVTARGCAALSMPACRPAIMIFLVSEKEVFKIIHT